MQTSNETNLFAKALCAAQSAIENADKDRKGNYGKYATLESVVEAVKGPLTGHGLSYTQWFEESDSDKVMRLTTRLDHESGQWAMSTSSWPVVKADPQGLASASTYARRYALMAATGICPEDDDGQAASPHTTPTPRPTQAVPKPPTPYAENAKTLVPKPPVLPENADKYTNFSDKPAETVPMLPANAVAFINNLIKERDAMGQTLDGVDKPIRAVTTADTEAYGKAVRKAVLTLPEPNKKEG